MISIKDMVKTNDSKSFDRTELEELNVKSYNNKEGNMNLKDNVDCPICKNKGYVAILKNGVLWLTDCECMRKREIIRRALKSGLGDYLNKRSTDYIATHDWQKKNKGIMIEFCKEHSKNNTWFTIVGTSGSGKTLIGSIISNHLLYNLERDVLYITWTDFISKLKRDVMGDNSNEVSEYLEMVKNVDVLFIDELLKKYNETDLKYIIEIINYRYSNDLKTIITSERNINELLDIDEATFSRVVEKSKKFVIDIPKDRSKNYRLNGLNLG